MNKEIKTLLIKRAEDAERKHADALRIADMIEAMCDNEIATLKKRIESLERDLYFALETDAEVDEDAGAREALRLQEFDRAEKYRNDDNLLGD